MNSRKMKQMMEQMGIDLQELDVEEVIIRTADEELVFTDAEVQRMDAQGQQTYQVVGSPESRDRTDAIEAGGGEVDADDASSSDDSGAGDIPDTDVEIVAQRTGASESDAREALEATGGDLAAAVERLE